MTDDSQPEQDGVGDGTPPMAGQNLPMASEDEPPQPTEYRADIFGGAPQCAAHSKQTGHRCRQPVMPGRHLCYFHGGKSLMGPANPAWKHGRYSKVLPPKVREIYEQSLQNPDLLSARDELALLEARVMELAARLKTGETAATWEKLQETYLEVEAAAKSGDTPAFQAGMSVIGKLIKDGVAGSQVWEELVKAIDDKGRVAAREHKMLVDQQQMLSAEEALTLIMSLMSSVKRHVSDRAALTGIAEDLNLLLRTERARMVR